MIVITMESAVVLLTSYVNVILVLKVLIVLKPFVRFHVLIMNIVMFLLTNPSVNVSQVMVEQAVLLNYVRMTVLPKESVKMEYVYVTMAMEETVVVLNSVLKTVLRMESVRMDYVNVMMVTLVSTVKRRVVL